MAEDRAPYACDRCKDRKIGCSRDLSRCQRCIDDKASCVYSREGVIRRKRRRKNEYPSLTDIGYPTPASASSERHAVADVLQSHLASDIESARKRLDGRDESSLGALASLSEACAAVWHSNGQFEQSRKQYFLFEDRSAGWVETFSQTMERGRPLMAAPSQQDLDLLLRNRPDRVERAWVVMYYSIVMSMVSSTEPENVDLKDKLRCNLWLALNDVRLFLEPSEANIQALTLLACHVEEFTTPSLCWMLIANACRMLQALGINSRRLDPETRERRRMIFWHLNLVDKGLAIIFGRPPTFHRTMAKEIPMPTLPQLTEFQPHAKAIASVFGAHYMHQSLMCTQVIADIWYCLYEDEAPGDQKLGDVRARLDAWYGEARLILEASARVEKPFLDPRGAASIDLGLCMRRFTHLQMTVLITRASPTFKSDCIDASRKMLSLLPAMVSDSEEPYNGIIWMLVCCPFTPLLVLFGEILSNGQGASEANLQSLDAMEKVPAYLQAMGFRNTLAKKLVHIAESLVAHANAVVASSGSVEGMPSSNSEADDRGLPNAFLDQSLDWNVFFDHALNLPMPDPSLQYGEPDLQLGDLGLWASGDANIDWIAWDSQLWQP